ncbi:MAG: hypothetical protein ABIG30_00955 [Candidatus Aenigmatarchaeota archaeon]
MKKAGGRKKRAKFNAIQALRERTKELVRNYDEDENIQDVIEDLHHTIVNAEERMNARVARLEDSFITFSDAIGEMKKEQTKLLEEKHVLEEEKKRLSGQIIDLERMTKPLKEEIHDTAKLFKTVMEPGGEKAFEKQQKLRKKAQELNQGDKEVMRMIKSGRLERVADTKYGKLYSMILDNEQIKTSDASLRFKMNEVEIEEMAKILERNKLIKIQYPVFGKPILMSKSRF